MEKYSLLIVFIRLTLMMIFQKSFLEEVKAAIGDEMFVIFAEDMMVLKSLCQRKKFAFAQKVLLHFISKAVFTNFFHFHRKPCLSSLFWQPIKA